VRAQSYLIIILHDAVDLEGNLRHGTQKQELTRNSNSPTAACEEEELKSMMGVSRGRTAAAVAVVFSSSSFFFMTQGKERKVVAGERKLSGKRSEGCESWSW
jgi:hypothetical protein